MFNPKINAQKIAGERVVNGNIATIPFATGGLNTKDPLPSMPAEDAIILQNFIVENDRIVSRNGYKNISENFTYTAPVESLFEYASATGTQGISCAGDKIYTNLSTPTQIGSGFSSARWQGLMMNSYLLLFNGQDLPQKYDGTTLTTNTFTGTGLTPTNLIGATNFKNRLIAWEENACGFWFGGSDAISGPLDFFDLSFITKKGGYVVSCAAWSYDSSGGTGMQARLVIFMSSGEALVYEGTDPSDVNQWGIVGKYRVAPPISQRAITEFAGDILILNEYDLVSFSDVFARGENPQTQTKLVGALKSAIMAYKLNSGWQLIYYPLGSLVIVNVPLGNNIFNQYIVNTRSGGVSQFTGYNGSCFAVINSGLYFGSTNKAFLALSGTDDNGDYINLDVQTSFNTFGLMQDKTLNYIQPSIAIDSDTNFNYSINYDFAEGNLSTSQLQSVSGNFWDTFYWDTVYWSANSEIKRVQYGVSGQGTYISYRIKTSIKNSQISLYSVAYSYSVNSF